MRRSFRLAGWLVIALAVAAVPACTGTWRSARRSDTVASYHRYLQSHPDGSHARDASEHLEFLRVKAHPTVVRFETFESTYSGSSLLPELRKMLEPLYFDQARARNSAVSYAGFVERYPKGRFSERAFGNRVYLEQVKADPTVERLAEFINTYPESDFVALARRTRELLDLHQKGRIERLVVQVRVGSSVDRAQRVRRGFAGIVQEAYSKYGVEVMFLPHGRAVPRSADARMQIDYNEVPGEGTFGGRSIRSHCRIRMFHRDLDEPIWDRVFDAPADHLRRGRQSEDPTVFGNRRYRFWEKFFIPVTTWPASRARLYRKDFQETISAVAVEGDRVAVLFNTGGIAYLDVSNPLEPVTLSHYHHERDLTRWAGVVLLPTGLAVAYGPSGAMAVDLSDPGTPRLGRWEALDVGWVRSGAGSGETVLLAGKQGLYSLRTGEKKNAGLHMLSDAPLWGVTVRGRAVFLVAESEVTVTGAAELVKWAIAGGGAAAPPQARARFPIGFGIERVHPVGDSLFLFGKGGVIEVGIGNPRSLALINHLENPAAAGLHDVVTLDGRLYLLGERGLEVTDRKGEWVSDLIQVDADWRLEAKDPFLLLSGGSVLEIFDASPYRSAAASMR